MHESSLHYSVIGAEFAPATLPYDPWIMANSRLHFPENCHFVYNNQCFMIRSPLRSVCAKLVPIRTVVINLLPAPFLTEKPWFHESILADPALDG